MKCITYGKYASENVLFCYYAFLFLYQHMAPWNRKVNIKSKKVLKALKGKKKAGTIHKQFFLPQLCKRNTEQERMKKRKGKRICDITGSKGE